MATNYAETSVTLPSVRHVIDSGKCFTINNQFQAINNEDQATASGNHETIYHPMFCGQEDSVTKAESTQRKGRVGRVADGIYCRITPEPSDKYDVIVEQYYL